MNNWLENAIHVNWEKQLVADGFMSIDWEIIFWQQKEICQWKWINLAHEMEMTFLAGIQEMEISRLKWIHLADEFSPQAIKWIHFQKVIGMEMKICPPARKWFPSQWKWTHLPRNDFVRAGCVFLSIWNHSRCGNSFSVLWEAIGCQKSFSSRWKRIHRLENDSSFAGRMILPADEFIFISY